MSSSDIFARVETFAAKADELGRKGHLLRAAENSGRAAEAARPLGADNLVMLAFQLQRGNVLCAFAAANAVADPQTCAAHRAEGVALLSGAVEALERRRVAGTLLEGKCAAAEVAWSTHEIQRDNADVPDAKAASLVALVGYEEYLRGAAHALDVLSCARLFAAECSDTQFQSFAQHVVHAVELMQQPRRHGDVILNTEEMLTDRLRDAARGAGANGLDARLVQVLAGAWERLQRSGVLQARRIEEHIESSRRAHVQEAIRAAIHRSLNAPGLRSCALEGCGAKEAHPTHFKSCAACRTVVYCCREHQVAGWPAHKKACKAARKAAAAADEDDAGPSGA